jgi:hypothetical protein
VHPIGTWESNARGWRLATSSYLVKPRR